MILFDNAGKAFRGKNGQISWVLRGISTRIPKGESLGILGRTGSGKTTLTNLICGNDYPSEGAIIKRGRFSYPYGFRDNLSRKLTLKQNLRFLTDLYGRDYEEACRFVAEFSELGRNMDQLLRQTTTEMKNRYAISVLLALDFDYIVVDQDMNFGDSKFRQKCSIWLDERAGRNAFVIVTDDESLVAKHCSIAGVLHDGRVEFYNSVPKAISVFRNLQRLSA